MWTGSAVCSGPKVVSRLAMSSVFPRAIQCFEIQIFCIPWFSPESWNRNWKKGCNFSSNQCCMRNCLLGHNLLYFFVCFCLCCVICCATCVASANELFLWVWCHVIVEKAMQVARNVASCNTRYATTCLAMSDSNYNLRGNYSDFVFLNQSRAIIKGGLAWHVTTTTSLPGALLITATVFLWLSCA